MSRFAQIRLAIGERPWRWAIEILFVLYLAVIFELGLVGTVVAFVALGLVDRLVFSRLRQRRADWERSKIGAIEMEIVTATDRQPSKFFIGAFVLFASLWLTLIGCDVFWMARSYFRNTGDDPNFSKLLLEASIFVWCARSIHRELRNRWLVLFTDEGVLQVVDSSLVARSGRRLDDPYPSPRVLRQYSWQQIVRFHWSQQSGAHMLHLNVHQTGFSVPQLVSFSLPGLAEDDWDKLDTLLRSHLSSASNAEPDRALAASSAPTAGI